MTIRSLTASSASDRNHGRMEPVVFMCGLTQPLTSGPRCLPMPSTRSSSRSFSSRWRNKTLISSQRNSVRTISCCLSWSSDPTLSPVFLSRPDLRRSLQTVFEVDSETANLPVCGHQSSSNTDVDPVTVFLGLFSVLELFDLGLYITIHMHTHCGSAFWPENTLSCKSYNSLRILTRKLG